ncbi:MAG: response regulator [bacterium]
MNEIIKLLLVDDEEEFLLSSSKALERRGFRVNIALNGVTALNLMEKNEFDVVVLDVKMPDIDGIEVFKQIRKKLPHLPVILLTGHGSIDDAFYTARDGIADYLTKPIDIDTLAKCIRDVVSKVNKQKKEKEKEPPSLFFDDVIRVLHIDDEVEFLESMRKVLERRNMSVTIAESGELALNLLKECMIDVAIVDVKMPGMNGLEVLSRIKKEYPYIEVILLTGHPSVEAAMEGIKLGANEYLKKPPEIDDLVATIRRLYNNRQEYLLEQQKKLIEEIRRRYPE